MNAAINRFRGADDRSRTSVGVSRYAINALETERHDPSLDLAFRIASAFGISVEGVFINPHEPTGAPAAANAD